MPPHCDALDGPVVAAAKQALQMQDVAIVLPFVHQEGEDEVRRVFDEVVEVRRAGGAAAEVADRLFFETVVRVHRAGEGAPFTGLKPAGLDHGPVIPVAERAIETGSPDELTRLLEDRLHHEVKERLDHVVTLQTRAGRGPREAREYTQAMLGLQVWSNKVFVAIGEDPHAAHRAYEEHAD